jgi:hypothetical protein
MDELELRLDAARRFTSATRGEAAAAKVTVDNLVQVERAIAVEARNLTAPASPPAVAAAPSQPQPQAGGRVDEATYQAMSAAERLDYCRSFTTGAR